MMKTKKIWIACLIGAMLIYGCAPSDVTVSAGEGETAAEVDQNVVIPQTGSTGDESDIKVVETQPVQASLETEEPSPTAEPETTPIIEHLIQPEEPAGKYQKIHDQTSDKYASQNRAYGGDDFNLGRFERSFLGDMTYLLYIDILTAELNREDPDWVFVRIQVMGDPAAGDPLPFFGVELDNDLDNRGEYLVLARVPSGSGWTADGVQVREDLDGDVGGDKPVRPDGSDGDGYENLIFDGGAGSDPDLAWVRISPLGPNYIELAYKNTLTGGEKGKFIWLPWVISGGAGAALFEFNDHFTLMEAGSPLKEDQDHYPLKNLWGIDNTCRGASGVKPQPSNTGVCPISEPEPSNEEPNPESPPSNFQPGPVTHG